MITREQAAHDAEMLAERGADVEADYARTVVALYDERDRLVAKVARMGSEIRTLHNALDHEASQ